MHVSTYIIKILPKPKIVRTGMNNHLTLIVTQIFPCDRKIVIILFSFLQIRVP